MMVWTRVDKKYGNRKPKSKADYDRFFEYMAERTNTNIDEIKSQKDVYDMLEKFDKIRKSNGQQSKLSTSQNARDESVFAIGRIQRSGDYQEKRRARLTQHRYKSFSDAKERGNIVLFGDLAVYSSVSRLKTKSGFKEVNVYRDSKGRFISKSLIKNNLGG